MYNFWILGIGIKIILQFQWLVIAILVGTGEAGKYDNYVDNFNLRMYGSKYLVNKH
jgi:hypothetical protein